MHSTPAADGVQQGCKPPPVHHGTWMQSLETAGQQDDGQGIGGSSLSKDSPMNKNLYYFCKTCCRPRCPHVITLWQAHTRRQCSNPGPSRNANTGRTQPSRTPPRAAVPGVQAGVVIVRTLPTPSPKTAIFEPKTAILPQQ
jgi:hypothetical protein